jgi:hypothetical protein
MKNWYKAIGMGALLIASAQSFAQTQYGVGAGMSGIQRAFFGTNAGQVNTGANNTFLGYQAGRDNTTGSHNTFVGKEAGLASIEGGGNTFVGGDAGRLNKSGNQNVYIGNSAGESSYASNYNTIIGNSACSGRPFGEYNSIMGHTSGINNMGAYNTFLGARVAFNNSGDDNVMIGFEAGHLNQKGWSNAFLGRESGFNNETGSFNAFHGTKSGYKNLSGNLNTFFGFNAGYNNETGNKNTYLGSSAGGSKDLQNATAIGAMALVTASNSVVLGNNANVGIGVSAPIYQLQLSQNSAAKPGNSTWNVFSDARLKKDVSDYTDGLQLLRQIKPVWFKYNGQAGIQTGDEKFVGIIAQDIQKIAPYMIGSVVYQDSSGNKSEYLDFNSNAITYMLINSVKEQQQMMEEKDAKIGSLIDRLDKIEKLVASLTDKPLNTGLAARDDVRNQPSMEQNVPNGFSQSTVIKYFIPRDVQHAVIDIYNSAGKKLESHIISERGAGELKVSADKLTNGVLIYKLSIDGKDAEAKKMVVNK